MRLTFSPLGRRGWLGPACVATILSPYAAFAANCTISGPTSAAVNQSFTLCAPSGSSSYDWEGAGMTSQSRCVTVRGLAVGSYEFALTTRDRNGSVDRCAHVVTVGRGAGGTMTCTITGPSVIDAGSTAEFCAPRSSLHTYEWSGPGGFTSTAQCIDVGAEGLYRLTIRNSITGYTRECTKVLDVRGGNSTACSITGPATIAAGTMGRLCGPVGTDLDYEWSGPGGFRSTARCIVVDDPGTYTLILTDQSARATYECRHRLAVGGDYGDDVNDEGEVAWDNCPRGQGFWMRQCQSSAGAAARDLSAAEVRLVASCIDARSGFINWANDYNGFCQALNPSRPLTRHKLAARQYAVLLANVCAGENSLTARNGERIGLDLDTQVTASPTIALRTIIERAEQMLVSRRGNFQLLAQQLREINGGRGIGPVCE